MDKLAGGASMRKKVTICECGLAKCYHECEQLARARLSSAKEKP